MQSAKDGVIIFSLGSYCSITEQAMADMFAEAFSQVPQKVIWKRRGKAPQKVPDNIKFMDVIPQNDLLGKCPNQKKKKKREKEKETFMPYYCHAWWMCHKDLKR